MMLLLNFVFVVYIFNCGSKVIREIVKEIALEWMIILLEILIMLLTQFAYLTDNI